MRLDPFLSRRALIAALAASACGRKRATRYPGWLFVASGAEKEIAVADLSSFRRVATIPLPCAPDQLFHSNDRVYAICHDARTLLDIDPSNFSLKGEIALAGKPVVARLQPQRSALVATEDANALLRVDLANRRVEEHLALAGPPADLDVNGPLAAVTIPSKNAIVRIDADVEKIAGSTDVGVPCMALRFRRDGRTILAGAVAAREIVALDSQSGQLLTRMGLPVSPSKFCFSPDGGEMFVTGSGADVIAIVRPFQNDVEETILAGRTPDAMAVLEPRNLLFVSNPGSGDLTILDIQTRGVTASVHVGEAAGEVMVTPDSEYVLVMERRSGSVSVVRVATVLSRRNRTSSPPSPLLTVFATAADARSAVIVPYAQNS